MTQRIPWLRILVEGAVIVASILLAFSIDAWWAGMQDRAEERLVLQALQTEFDDNLSGLRGVHEVHERYEAELSDLVGRMVNAGDGNTFAVADSLLRPLVSFRTADPAMGTLNTLLASGRIDLIRSQDLQKALAGWPAALEDAAEDETLVRDFVHGQLMAGLVGAVDLGRLLDSWGALGPTGRTTRTSGPVEYSLRVSERSRALVGQRHHLARLVVLQSQDRLDAGEAILALINGELSPT